MTRIIVFKEKHGDRYFDASTEEAKLKAMLSVLRERAAEGWYSEPTPTEHWFSEDDQLFLRIPEEAVKLMSEEDQARIVRVARRQEQQNKVFEQELVWWNNLRRVLTLPVEEAVKEPWATPGRVSKRSAIEVLVEAHRDFEYEGFEFIHLETPKV